MNIRYVFSSNHNIHKSPCGLCFWAKLIDFSKIYLLKGLRRKNIGQTNFNNISDLTKKVPISNINQKFYLCCSRKNSTLPSHLVGDETMDQKIVCDWFASSYGEVDKEYHEGESQVQI